jgi:hypothetical protein
LRGDWGLEELEELEEVEEAERGGGNGVYNTE